jgi:hypothetical protein
MNHLFVNLHRNQHKQGVGDGNFSGTSAEITAKIITTADTAYEAASGANCYA